MLLKIRGDTLLNQPVSNVPTVPCKQKIHMAQGGNSDMEHFDDFSIILLNQCLTLNALAVTLDVHFEL